MLDLSHIHLELAAENGEMKTIISDLSCSFSPGKLYGITGQNGGGKTSLAKVIMGIYPEAEGSIFLDGQDIGHMSITERARQGISYAFQNPPRFKGLTVQEILTLAAGKSKETDLFTIRTALREVGLCPEDYLERDLDAKLSGGEIKRIEMAQILLKGSRVNIFDEPEAGVDLWTMQKLINLMISACKQDPEKITILISHNERVLPLCDEIIIINDGEIQERGTTKEIWHMIKGDIECQTRPSCHGEVIHEFIKN